MDQAAITGSGVFTPTEIITNDELVTAFNAYADRFNAEHADAIAAGDTAWAGAIMRAHVLGGKALFMERIENAPAEESSAVRNDILDTILAQSEM